MYIQCIINKMLSKTFLSKNRLTAKYGINPQQTSALFVINWVIAALFYFKKIYSLSITEQMPLANTYWAPVNQEANK